jgi:hypothetical protein
MAAWPHPSCDKTELLHSGGGLPFDSKGLHRLPKRAVDKGPAYSTTTPLDI